MRRKCSAKEVRKRPRTLLTCLRVSAPKKTASPSLAPVLVLMAESSWGLKNLAIGDLASPSVYSI